ncbi:MAG: Arm DNA-binding domain-containing protein, partial [Succinivibrio dextrinosolvens]|nr:Arm DNA-binding domain-containing protein [Succinivibrio dextrinosolvens]
MRKIITHKEFIKEIENALSKNKKTSINCGGNLFNEISAKGLCTFYVRIRTTNQDTKKLLGRFPDLSLKDARDKANIELSNAKEENEMQQ